MPTTLSFRYAALLAFVFILTVLIYWPGLMGNFIFDDYPNLDGLKILNDEQAAAPWFQFITEGFSGSLGRPISLLSFALQAESWPDHPAHFKQVNILLHLINGGLIFWLLLQVGRAIGWTEEQRFRLAFLTAAIWLLHPFNVSTTLYVVQRMTQLSALFIILGLIAYIHGRFALAAHNNKRALLWMSFGIGVGGMCAVFSKENGVLLILYTLALEFTLLNALSRPRFWQYWATLFLYAPLLLLIAYFSYRFNSFHEAYQTRPFTLVERLLTQPRVLLDYVSKILLIQPMQFGLFHDDFPTSKGLLTPFSTLLVMLAWGLALWLALWQRVRWPLFAFAVLWFLGGHLLESSFIPLFMYFEHRNYLPMLGILFALVYGMDRLLFYLKDRPIRKILLGVTGLWLCCLPLLTYNEARLWGMPLVQAKVWADTHPQSRLALFHAAVMFADKRQMELAEGYYQQLMQYYPNDISPPLTALAASCHIQRLNPPPLAQLLSLLTHGQLDAHVSSALSFLTNKVLANQCQTVTLSDLEQIYQLLLTHPKIATYTEDLYSLYAQFLAETQRPAAAVLAAEQALTRSNSIPLQLNRIHWLIQAGQIAQARADLIALRDRWYWWQQRGYQATWDILWQWVEDEA